MKKPAKLLKKPTEPSGAPQNAAHACPYFDYDRKVCGHPTCYLRKQTVEGIPCRYFYEKGNK